MTDVLGYKRFIQGKRYGIRIPTLHTKYSPIQKIKPVRYVQDDSSSRLHGGGGRRVKLKPMQHISLGSGNDSTTSKTRSSALTFHRPWLDASVPQARERKHSSPLRAREMEGHKRMDKVTIRLATGKNG